MIKYIILLLILLFPGTVSAQNAISLSVSPPLFEIMIKPGKEIKQTYSLTNNGGDAVITPKIVYFETLDELGSVELTDNPAPDWIRFNSLPFVLKNGDRIDFDILISPPSDTEEIDHFLTLIFESGAPVDLLNQNSTSYQSQIGTNILLTISKDGNPKKSAEIVKFSAPKIIDSLFNQLTFVVVLKNNGNSFWKPIGKITINNEILNLTPQNILSGRSRTISCVDNENLIDCKLKNKFYIGKIRSNLEFSIDDDPKIYKSEAITYSFPFLMILAFILLGTIFKVWQKRK